MKSKLSSLNLGYGVILVLSACLFAALSLSTKNFLSYSNVYSMLYGVSIQFFAIVGFTYLMIMGEIDLSVGSMYGFGGAFLGYGIHVMKLGFVPAFLLALLLATCMGFAIGLVVTRFRINSMMVTLGAMMAVQGLGWILINSYSARSFGREAGRFIRYRVFDVNWTVIFLFVTVIVLEVLLHTNSLFKKMFYIGQQRLSSMIYGIKADRIKVATFALSAFCAGFAGILATCRIGNAHVSTGEGLEFTMVTAAVLGGASLFGGRGAILPSVAGLFFITMLQNGMTAFSIQPFTQKIVQGVILIGAVMLDMGLTRKRK